MEINCIEYFFIHFGNIFWSVVATLSPLGGAWQHATFCGRNTVYNTGLALHVIARLTHRPTSYTLSVAVEPYFNWTEPLTNKKCSLLVHYFVFETFDHWWLTDCWKEWIWMAALYSPGNVYITTLIGHPWPVEQNIFNTRSTGWSYDDLSYITWNWWRNKLCFSFSKHMTLQMVRIWLCNRPAKPGAKLLVKSANKNTAKYDSTCKRSEQTWIKHFLLVRLCCDCRDACGSRTQSQLRSWVAHVTADAESRLS